MQLVLLVQPVLMVQQEIPVIQGKQVQPVQLDLLAELPAIESKCDDHERIDNIRRSATVTLQSLNTIASALHDPA